jgi:hypothetical protein
MKSGGITVNRFQNDVFGRPKYISGRPKYISGVQNKQANRKYKQLEVKRMN